MLYCRGYRVARYSGVRHCYLGWNQHHSRGPELKPKCLDAVREALFGREVKTGFHHVKVDSASRAGFAMLQLAQKSLGVPSGRQP